MKIAKIFVLAATLMLLGHSTAFADAVLSLSCPSQAPSLSASSLRLGFSSRDPLSSTMARPSPRT